MRSTNIAETFCEIILGYQKYKMKYQRGRKLYYEGVHKIKSLINDNLNYQQKYTLLYLFINHYI